MGWFPGAIRKVVARHDTPRTRDRGLCLHVAVSEAASLYNYFNQPGNPTSTWYVRRDGTVEQYVDSRFRAPAQLEGNPTMLSVETQGGTVDANTEPWSAAQVEALARIAAWCHTEHGIPLDQMPDSRPATNGIGYHRLGVNPWRVSGGELWSSANGKICPGQGKINQIPTIIKRARLIAAEGDDGTMAWTDAQIEAALQLQRDALEAIDKLYKQVYLIQVRSDYVTNKALPALGVDVDRAADKIAGEDDPT